jgi:hypothetical protein
MKHRKANWNYEEVNMKNDSLNIKHGFSSRRDGLRHMKYEEVNWNHDAAKGGTVPHSGNISPTSAARQSQLES